MILVSLSLAGPAAAGSSDWMASVDSARPLRTLAIPGTHDSASYEGVPVDRESSRESHSAALAAHPEHYENQAFPIARQLDEGIRFLDVRISGCGRGGREDYSGQQLTCFPTRHGHMVFKDNAASHVALPVRQFLIAHPTETVLVSLKSDFASSGCDNDDNNDCDDRNYPLSGQVGRAGLYQLFMNNPLIRDYIYRKPSNRAWTDVTLGEVRGKIVLLDRLGLLDHDHAMPFPSGEDRQDFYDVDWDQPSERAEKQRYIRQMFDLARQPDRFRINFLSAVDTDGIPTNIDDFAVLGNTTARTWLAENRDPIGVIVPMDSVDDAVGSFRALTQDLIARNQPAAPPPPPPPPIPTGRDTYLRISDANLSLHASGGSAPSNPETLHPCPQAANHPNCQWRLEPSPSRPGAYYVRVSDKALYLHAAGGAVPGAAATLHPCPKAADHANCQWVVESSTTRPGAFYLRSAGANLSLHASGGSTSGAPAILHACPRERDHGNCQWRMP